MTNSLVTTPSQLSFPLYPENLIRELSDEEVEKEYVRRNCNQPGAHFGGSSSVAKHLKALFMMEQEREHLVVLFLNSQHSLLKSEIMFTGSVSQSAVYPREIVIKVLEYRASAVVLGHNHPSGSLTPSSSDRAVTKKLVLALDSIDVQILDHIIVGYGNSEYFSFADHHLL